LQQLIWSACPEAIVERIHQVQSRVSGNQLKLRHGLFGFHRF
jgi:hypothetical protein